MSNWLVAIIGGAIATIIGGVILFYLLPQQQTSAFSSAPVGPAGPKHLECTMKGGFFEGRATFSLDLGTKKGEWQGLGLEIRRLTEQHVSAYAGWRFDGDRYPPHDGMEFLFDRLTLKVQASLFRAADEECLARVKRGLDFCDLIPNRVGEASQGQCREIARPL